MGDVQIQNEGTLRVEKSLKHCYMKKKTYDFSKKIIVNQQHNVATNKTT